MLNVGSVILIRMLKNKYTLSQELCCQPHGNFVIHELPDDGAKDEQESGFSQLNFAPQSNVGKFSQDGMATCCCTCRRITRLSLQLYGQRLSLAESATNNSCLMQACQGELVVYSHNKVILGKVKKTCSAWCSSSVLVIENESQQEAYRIRMRCCQIANILPRILSCAKTVAYEIVNPQGIVVGHVTAGARSCHASILTLQDDFHVHFLSVQKEKEKILLLNAVVYLNLMRHEWL